MISKADKVNMAMAKLEMDYKLKDESCIGLYGTEKEFVVQAVAEIVAKEESKNGLVACRLIAKTNLDLNFKGVEDPFDLFKAGETCGMRYYYKGQGLDILRNTVTKAEIKTGKFNLAKCAIGPDLWVAHKLPPTTGEVLTCLERHYVSNRKYRIPTVVNWHCVRNIMEGKWVTPEELAIIKGVDKSESNSNENDNDSEKTGNLIDENDEIKSKNLEPNKKDSGSEKTGSLVDETDETEILKSGCQGNFEEINNKLDILLNILSNSKADSKTGQFVTGTGVVVSPTEVSNSIINAGKVGSTGSVVGRDIFDKGFAKGSDKFLNILMYRVNALMIDPRQKFKATRLKVDQIFKQVVAEMHIEGRVKDCHDEFCEVNERDDVTEADVRRYWYRYRKEYGYYVPRKKG